MGEFILVEHDALKRKKHWDLRFTIPNSKNWISFAMNGLPPTEPGQRVYIVRTTDHSREQALFIGKIPEGEYGAGTLKKVEKGTCEIIKYTNAHIIVDFKGHKLSGIYHFVNTATFTKSRDYSKKTYAFFKAKTDIKNLKEEYLLELSISKSIGISILLSMLMTLYLLKKHIISETTYIHSLPNKTDEKLTKKIREIVDDEVVVKIILDKTFITACNDGTPNLYYSEEFVNIFNLTENELIAVLLHEYGHYKEGHTKKWSKYFTISSFGIQAFISTIVVITTPKIAAGILLFILGSLDIKYMYKVLNKYIGRSWEFTADEYSKKYGYEEHAISAFKKYMDYDKNVICKKMISMSVESCLKYLRKESMWDEHPSDQERIDALSKSFRKIVLLAKSNTSKIDKLINKIKPLLFRGSKNEDYILDS